FAGQSSTPDFDTAIDIYNNSTGGGAFAEFGNGNLTFVDAANSHAFSGGDTVYSGGPLGEPGSYDFGATLFEDNTFNHLATGADYLYDIVSALGNLSGTAAVTSGGWL